MKRMISEGLYLDPENVLLVAKRGIASYQIEMDNGRRIEVEPTQGEALLKLLDEIYRSRQPYLPPKI